jgi:hypothetical protein
MGQSKPPKSNRDRYMERAMELRAMAHAATDPSVKTELLVLAQQYDKLATDLAHLKRGR